MVTKNFQVIYFNEGYSRGVVYVKVLVAFNYFLSLNGGGKDDLLAFLSRYCRASEFKDELPNSRR